MTNDPWCVCGPRGADGPAEDCPRHGDPRREFLVQLFDDDREFFEMLNAFTGRTDVDG